MTYSGIPRLEEMEGESRMKVVILDPKKVVMAGLVSALLMAGSVLGVVALAGVFRSRPAEAYGSAGAGAKHWYFAEGYTGPGFEEWILTYNPPTSAGGSGATFGAVIEIYGQSGLVGLYDVSSLGPGQRRSININSVAQSLYGYSGDISIHIYSPTRPFICERAMYYNYKGQITGGSQVFGYQEGAKE